MKEIQNWASIQKDFSSGTLVLGNGASISICSNLDYKSLCEHAKERGCLDQNIDRLFKKLNTNNFEKLLEYLYKAELTNKALKLNHRKPKKYYDKLRKALLKTVKDVHPSPDDVKIYLPQINKFIKDFHTIINMNYDLILYWAIMELKDNIPNDLFLSGDLSLGKLEHIGEPIIVYPHGSLFICKALKSCQLDKSEQVVNQDREFKLHANRNSNYLFSATILEILEANSLIDPVFISEGGSCEKIKSILSYEYLAHVYEAILPEIKYRQKNGYNNNITFFGFSFSENDAHLLQQLAMGTDNQKNAFKFDGAAISVFKDDLIVQENSQRMLEKYSLVKNNNITFFDAETCGWPQSNSNIQF